VETATLCGGMKSRHVNFCKDGKYHMIVDFPPTPVGLRTVIVISLSRKRIDMSSAAQEGSHYLMID
jgi:hypothetical protein